MSMDPAAALDALGDPTRREIFERVVARPCRIGFLADHVAVSRPAVSHHIKVLKACGLVREEQGLLLAAPDVLPALRTYFDRLWFEASVGEAWLRDRFAISKRVQWMGCEVGLPAEDTAA
jgi:DNA-binding transcriptional ArsR family regulator